MERSFLETGETFRLGGSPFCLPQTGSEAAFIGVHAPAECGTLPSPNLAGKQSRNQSVFGPAKDSRDESNHRF